MSRASNNGSLPDEYRDVVREQLALGGMPAVHRHFARTVGDGTLLAPALTFANRHVLGNLYSDDELADFADSGADQEIANQKALVAERARRNARTALNEEGIAPIEFPRATLAKDLKAPPREQPFVVEELLPVEGNAVLVGSYKTGKTVLAMNLAKSLADEEPFLGVFDTHLDGNVGYLNYELSADMFREWMRALDVQNQDRIIPFHLRGMSLPFWSKAVHDAMVAWLQSHEVGFLILDPAARAWRPLIENENDNSQMAAFTEAVDELKRDADVTEVFIATHTGRGIQQEDNERARGATRLEDWMDAGLYLTKGKDGRRFLRAMGRDVELEGTALDYDSDHKALTFSGQTRTQVRTESVVVGALQALADMEAGGERATSVALRNNVSGEKALREAAIKQAVDDGYVDVKVEGKGAHVHTLSKKGRKYLLKAGGQT
jgi:AAA domain